jgi:hypothetical protein
MLCFPPLIFTDRPEEIKFEPGAATHVIGLVANLQDWSEDSLSKDIC